MNILTFNKRHTKKYNDSINDILYTCRLISKKEYIFLNSVAKEDENNSCSKEDFLFVFNLFYPNKHISFKKVNISLFQNHLSTLNNFNVCIIMIENNIYLVNNKGMFIKNKHIYFIEEYNNIYVCNIL